LPAGRPHKSHNLLSAWFIQALRSGVEIVIEPVGVGASEA